MPFQISALDAEPFAPLFEMPPQALASYLAERRIATAYPGFPCRVSLEDAQVGEEVLLINYTHQPATSPYLAGHAIFVRKGAKKARPAVGEVPDALRARVLSLRAFDMNAMIVSADLCEGKELERALAAQLRHPAVAYVHIHFAKFGCYAARAQRA